MLVSCPGCSSQSATGCLPLDTFLAASESVPVVPLGCIWLTKICGVHKIATPTFVLVSCCFSCPIVEFKSLTVSGATQEDWNSYRQNIYMIFCMPIDYI